MFVDVAVAGIVAFVVDECLVQIYVRVVIVCVSSTESHWALLVESSDNIPLMPHLPVLGQK